MSVFFALSSSKTYPNLTRHFNVNKALDIVVSRELDVDFLFGQRAFFNKTPGNSEAAKKDQKRYNDYQAREKDKWDNPDHYYHYQ